MEEPCGTGESGEGVLAAAYTTLLVQSTSASTAVRSTRGQLAPPSLRIHTHASSRHAAAPTAEGVHRRADQRPAGAALCQEWTTGPTLPAWMARVKVLAIL